MRRLQTFDRIDALPAAAWDALHGSDHPFVQHAFLSGLEQHGCIRREWGWTARHAALFDGQTLVAAAPAYLKANSHGEFVFAHAWARAYHRLGIEYFPKWLVAAPYSPVTGPRVLGRTPRDRRDLLDAMRRHADAAGLSSLHVNFIDDEAIPDFDDAWLARSDVQFHWTNAGWRSFEEFLAALELRKRKNIRQERAKVARSGLRLVTVHGNEATPAQLEAMHGFYADTQHAYGNHPALTLEFFQHLAQRMPRQLVIFLAEDDDGPVAGALCLRGGDTLYGRYWGSRSNAAGLHFECCYYQGIDYCLREGLMRFEPGAQGEHKVARGFLPVLTHSRHWLADPRIAAAISSWCAEERAASLRYRERVLAHGPFRDPIADPLAGV